jgi:hypothetical protein
MVACFVPARCWPAWRFLLPCRRDGSCQFQKVYYLLIASFLPFFLAPALHLRSSPAKHTQYFLPFRYRHWEGLTLLTDFTTMFCLHLAPIPPFHPLLIFSFLSSSLPFSLLTNNTYPSFISGQPCTDSTYRLPTVSSFAQLTYIPIPTRTATPRALTKLDQSAPIFVN